MNVPRGVLDAVNAVRAINPAQAAMSVSKSAYDTLTNPGALISKQYLYDPQTKRALPFLPYEGKNIAQDVGTGIQANQSTQDLAQKEALAKSFEAKGDYHNANMVRQQISSQANSISQSFSPSINENPYVRSITAANEIGQTAGIVSGALDLTNKAAAHYAGEDPRTGGMSAEEYRARLAAGRKDSPYTEYERALNSGDMKTAEEIAQQHPGDAHFQAHKIGQNAVDPKQTFLKAQADQQAANDVLYGRDQGDPLMIKARDFATKMQKEVPKRTYEPTVVDPMKVKFNDFDLKNATSAQVEKARQAIMAGTHDPIVIDENGGLMDGTHRTMAAQRLGVKLPAVIERNIVRN